MAVPPGVPGAFLNGELSGKVVAESGELSGFGDYQEFGLPPVTPRLRWAAHPQERTPTVPTPQQPIGSGFDAASTTADVIAGIDLSGKVAVVTGGYSGLGRETARTLAAAGADVIVPARDPGRAAAALQGLKRVSVGPMDLLDPASVDAFASRFLATGRPLDILVNSAGIMAAPLARDSRGYESQFATNHLGHFQLTARLWEALSRANGARVVSVSSLGHRYSPVVFDDPNFEHREYNPWAAYGQSKTANILFAVELDSAAGTPACGPSPFIPAASPGPASNGTSRGKISKPPASSTKRGTRSSIPTAT